MSAAEYQQLQHAAWMDACLQPTILADAADLPYIPHIASKQIKSCWLDSTLSRTSWALHTSDAIDLHGPELQCSIQLQLSATVLVQCPGVPGVT